MSYRARTDGGVTDSTLVIPKDKAAFRLDGNGQWHNHDGPFRHQRVIDHFNAAIDKDEMGYFITQQRGGITEKVYFPHEGTVLFVVDVLWGKPTQLKLNTGRLLALDPNKLFVREDHLYYRLGDENAKFNQLALMEMSDKLTCDEGKYYFSNGSTRVAVMDQGIDPRCMP